MSSKAFKNPSSRGHCGTMSPHPQRVVSLCWCVSREQLVFAVMHSHRPDEQTTSGRTVLSQGSVGLTGKLSVFQALCSQPCLCTAIFPAGMRTPVVLMAESHLMSLVCFPWHLPLGRNNYSFPCVYNTSNILWNTSNTVLCYNPF